MNMDTSSVIDFCVVPDDTVTKKDIISALGNDYQEQIFFKYLGLQVNYGKKYKSPLREDKNPTCSFYKTNTGKIYFKDFAASYGLYNSMDCFSLVQYLYNCDFQTCLWVILKDFNLKVYTIKNNVKKPVKKPKLLKTAKKPTNKTIKCIFRKYIKKDIDYWMQYNISKNILDLYCVLPAYEVYMNDNILYRHTKFSPIYVYVLKQNEYKIYRPFNTHLKWICNGNNIIQGYEQYLNNPVKNAECFVITKSMKDVMMFRSFGINAIAPHSESQFIPEKILLKIKEKEKCIFLNYDNDETGKENTNKITTKYPFIKNLIVPDTYKSKDFSDLCIEKGIEFTKTFIQNETCKYA